MKVKITVTAGPAKGQVFDFDEPDCFLFGRTKDARVSLPDDPYVSRQHFLLEIAPPSCRVTDLDSKNGTFVNGVRFGGRKAPEPGVKLAPKGVNDARLRSNDEIVVGDTKMKVEIVSPQALNTDAMPDEIPPTRTLAESGKPALRHAPPPPLPKITRQMRKSFEDQLTVPDNGGEGGEGERTMLEPPSPEVTEARTVAEGVDYESMPLPPGEKADLLELDDAPLFPGFRIEEILGEGGMGRVYKAKDLRTGQLVAIKAMIPQVAVSFSNFRAFHREIELTRQLSHNNIVRFLGLGKVKGAFYCVLEFVQGMDLRAYVKRNGRKLPIQEVAPIMFATLDGLAYAHRKPITIQSIGRTNVFHGIVHRDLKPENILLAIEPSPHDPKVPLIKNGRKAIVPKVADFGLSKSYESAGMTDMTMAGVAGTPAYWPREQITHYRYLHPATDVFSIAAVFYEILTGATARPGLQKKLDDCRICGRSAQISDFIRVISENEMKPLRSVNPDVPAPVAAVFDRALRETEVPVNEVEMRKVLAELRYKDAGEFRDALAKACAEARIPV